LENLHNTPLEMASNNPWIYLPPTAPYILSEDLEVIQNHKNFLGLRLDTLPEPLVGGLNNARIVFLALNPGFTDSDVNVNMKLDRFIQGCRNNLQDPFNSDFYYFTGGLEETGGYKWWSSRLKPLIQQGITEDTLKKRIMMIEYFPYHSVNYKHIGRFTPSQHFSFELVKEAIKQNKVIVIMRSKSLWLEAVPELADYSYMTLSSAQNVVISPKNIGELNFKVLLSELR
jgi:hypothetical protein